MKIAYYIYWLDGFESGVIKKITDQITYWKSKNYDVKLFVYTKKDSNFENDYNSKRQALPFDIEVHCFTNRLSQLKDSYKIYKDINNYKPDIVYMRESKLYPGLYKLNKKYNSIVEINSITNNEINKKSIQYWYNKLTLYFKFKNIKAFVAVTNEIAKHKTLTRFKAPKYVIGNGINLATITPLSVSKNQTINLVFIGSSGQKWHGIDKIINLAKLKPNWNFSIIGVQEENNPLKNVIFYGKLNKKEYEKIFQKADVAIGTLALYRNKMQEACPLKTREYLAYGLPVIIGYKDVDFTNNEEYICQISNTKSNITEYLEKIEKFVETWKNKRVGRIKIKHLDVDFKEKKRLDIFVKTVNNAK